MKNDKIEKEWADMTTAERAEHCERIADEYGPGFCRDQVLAQAAQLWAKAEIEKDYNKFNKGEQTL